MNHSSSSPHSRHSVLGVACLFVGLAWAWGASPAGAATLPVGGGGEGVYATIQSAIDAASAGDTVLVYPGRYRETISMMDVDVRLMSLAGPASTIIDGNGRGPVIRCLGLSENSSIEGFTVTGGVANQPMVGGGIYLIANASPLIRDNIVTGNRAEVSAGAVSAPAVPAYCEPEPGSGGGIFVHFTCTPEIIDNTIADNEAKRNGGGIVFWDHANALMKDNRVYRNTAGRYGGGVYAGCNSAPTIEGNVLAWNGALDGGGVCLEGYEADAVLLRNTFYMNSASSGAGGIQCKGACKPTIRANLIGVAKGSGVACDPETDAAVDCNVAWGAGGEAFGGDCFPLGVAYGDRDNVIEEVRFCDPYEGDFRPCSRPLERRCGQVGAEGDSCPRGECGRVRISWGLLKSLYR